MAFEIKYINVNGGGFNERRTVEDGTTVDQFLAQAMPGQDRARFNIRVNNAIPVPGQQLRSLDSVSVIPGKFDGGAFGSELLTNLKHAAELGKLARQTPDLVTDLQAINSLGAAIRQIPDLAGNLNALVEFVGAVKVLDQPAASDDPVADDGEIYSPEFNRLASVITRQDAIELLGLFRQFGGTAGLTRALTAGESAPSGHGTDATLAPAAVVGTRAIDTTPPAPGCVRLVTGFGLGRPERIEADETIIAFFNRVKPDRSPADYRIEVNGTTVEAGDVLHEGDSVLIRNLGEVRGKLASGSSCT
jgi:hypothetical protein